MRNVKVAAAGWNCVLGIVLKRLKDPVINASDTFLEEFFELSGCCRLRNGDMFDGHP